ncbi:Sterol desaturase/sphingolipid hydroxylase, fatty acid hydroxylase superfamily [Mariprofundus ferrinatatus]|uniref:Sterol desaturase/sphingolipid hydroxylase, fatty acid hydroxylase superfamily n=1 Tax=Mariprofundus ferrinatatus TaxID=1921087 RepID=A0A2K8L845_9PROT|nr:sterol desaturase family protein [Mariprofundus ferrinatatus]ATX81104.1 Sterol desaturase/sphingolipid hydroxylase, fatty acid hydroxylase superfamily [Mariprofundus ferrinatatus]
MDESTLRLAAFVAIFGCMALAQTAAPRRRLRFGYRRWPANLGIVLLNTFLVRLLFPAGAVGAALWADANAVGLFNLVELPPAATVALSVILLDLIIYWQHVIFHAVPMLWRLHRVHHADNDIDVTTGLRFHPIEIILSMLVKISFIIAVGAPATAVVIFEIVLNGMAMFNHANVRLPRQIDSAIRLLLVTPDVHRVHHSVIPAETDSNFGFNLSIWDRIFGTWKAQPDMGHDGMTIGLTQLQHAPTHSLAFMLRLPFQGDLGQYPSSNRKKERLDV